jgi:hypothetical protein
MNLSPLIKNELVKPSLAKAAGGVWLFIANPKKE